MIDRRQFLGALGVPAVSSLAASLLPARALAAVAALGSGSPESVAADESAWREVQEAFTVDRSLINLNSGGVSPSTARTQAAMKGYLDYSNTAPVYAMWRILEPQRESIRLQLAGLFGCDAEEVALTRNASESLQICQLGFDLRAGDEILTTNQDYPRMITTFEQRARREGVVLRQFSIPVPAEDPDEIVALFEENITDRTRLILMCHMINLTGQVLPVRPVVQMARKRGIPVIVDGAHSFAQFGFRHEDLDCDYFGTSLHKWLYAPHGTGLLYVRRERIGGLWPMMAAPEKMDDDVRKFEEIGTHPAANYLAIGEAVAFHEGIGAERKAARLRRLRDYWVDPLLESDRVVLHTSRKPGLSCGIANVQILGVDSGALGRHLWRTHRIIVVPIQHADFEGIRVSPNLFTTVQELDRFVDAVQDVIRDGIPAAEA
ncbi:MAG: aminotransferase class V-fold PLP-dependent enzyme [Acidobacteriota bacterium]|jgi:selenocysteine lyase/cysteine desulfurase